MNDSSAKNLELVNTHLSPSTSHQFGYKCCTLVVLKPLDNI